MQAIVLDTETSSKEGNPCEIAWLGVDLHMGRLQPLAIQHNQRYHPLEPMSLGAISVHHILDEDVAECPPHTSFRLPEGIRYIIGHNIDFDLVAIGRSGVDISPYHAICTLALSRYLWPAVESHTLSSMAYFHAENRAAVRQVIKHAHSAMTDVKLTAALLRCIVRQTKVEDLAALYALSEQARVPSTMSFGKHKGTAIADLPADYVSWLGKQVDLDPYLVKALRLHHRF
jgi:exodeoxyribonuclease X